MSRAFVLSGGASLGAIQVGMLHALIERGIAPDLIVGTSAGAINGALANRFLGSPTLRIDGVDIDPAAADRTDFGLKCRSYQTVAGLSPTPPDDWVLAALNARGRGAIERPARTVDRA